MERPTINHEIKLAPYVVGRTRAVTVDGQEFKSINAMLMHYSIPEHTYRNILSKYDVTHEEALSMAIDKAAEDRRIEAEKARKRGEETRQREEREKARKKAAEFSFEGKIYPSLERAVEDLSWDNDIFLNAKSIRARAKKNGCPLDEQLRMAIDKHLKRAAKDKAVAIKESGKFYGMCMGEIYENMLKLLSEGDLWGFEDIGVAEYIADRANADIDRIRELISDFSRYPASYSITGRTALDWAKIREDNRREIYEQIYKRYDWPARELKPISMDSTEDDAICDDTDDTVEAILSVPSEENGFSHTCKNCPHLDIITDEEYCKRAKCMAAKSKNGKTITWCMCWRDGNVIQYFSDHFERHPYPKWCPERTAKKEVR